MLGDALGDKAAAFPAFWVSSFRLSLLARAAAMPPSATHREWAKCKSQSELHDTRLNHFKTSMETKFAPAADPVQEVPSLTATHSRSAAHLPALLTLSAIALERSVSARACSPANGPPGATQTCASKAI